MSYLYYFYWGCGWKLLIISRCNNKPLCIAYANIEVLGDPCHGISKYLEIQYACVKSGKQQNRESTDTKLNYSYEYIRY